MITAAPFNQSLMSFILILDIPVEQYHTWPSLVVPAYAKIINYIFAAFSFAFFALYYFKNPEKNRLVALFGITALIPIISTYGWEYAYVLAAPLLFYVLLASVSAGAIFRWLAFLAVLMFIFPKPPDSIINKLSGKIPDIIITLGLYRYIFATILLAVLAVWQNRRR
jgi:hypothetical protein